MTPIAIVGYFLLYDFIIDISNWPVIASVQLQSALFLKLFILIAAKVLSQISTTW